MEESDLIFVFQQIISQINADRSILRQAINQKGRESVRDALLPEQLQDFDLAMRGSDV